MSGPTESSDTPTAAPEAKAAAVNTMFTAIAPRYDLLNHLLSFGVDLWWRKVGTEALGPLGPGQTALDLACGTGDFALQIARVNREANVVGADFVEPMVEIARHKGAAAGLAHRVRFEQGDAMGLRYADASFDGITCAFGVRNFGDLQKGLAEMARVITPGSRMVILEFTTPTNRLFGALYRFYFTKVLPFLGGLLSGRRSAYEYLPDSVYKFPDPPAFIRMLEEAGLTEVTFRPLTFGICGLYAGTRA
ncbi:MAG: bifunctional demethylmenaquinone methyltransferase/2-methoxy-6-polyprenyl-1,4-benzoquinol methylase UbiE [Nitrospinae bacterium]|nr:bifunctional demethylmenaquinone methyltransferase/2-methoxy-6-polyprenyl-1,4-benzoquinol methylase UbiE [Nitrospinota bacterium]